jgi:hypothetical protein
MAARLTPPRKDTCTAGAPAPFSSRRRSVNSKRRSHIQPPATERVMAGVNCQRAPPVAASSQ